MASSRPPVDIVQRLPLDSTVDIRMSSILDWRDILKSPDQHTLGGQPISGTKSIHDRISHGRFYAQHPRLFQKYCAGRERQTIVLDLGCGAADGVETWVRGCKHYSGCDASLEQLRLARKYLPCAEYPNTTFVLDHVSSEYFADDSIDFLISSEVFEHLDSPEQHLAFCFRKLRPNGVLSLSTPCPSIYFYPSQLLASLLFRPRRLHLMLHAHRHWKEALPWHPAIRPSELADMARERGFKILEQFACLWYVETPARLSMRTSAALEKLGFTFQLDLFRKWVTLLESLTNGRLPVLRFAGTRQFLVAHKPSG